jgi:hypothetical protein
VNDRNFQIAQLPAEELAQPFPTQWCGCSGRVVCLTIALILAVVVAQSSLNASDAPTAYAGKVSKPASMIGAYVLGVHYDSQSSYSRLVIDLSADVRHKVGHLTNPERVYLDFPKTEISPRLTTRQIAVQDGLINQVRIGSSRGPVTRVVLDLVTPVRYRVTKGDSPARMLIELSTPPEGTVLAESIPLGMEEAAPTPASANSTNSQGALPAGRAAPFIPHERDIPSGSPPGPQTYGSGEKAGLNYAGSASPRNTLLLGFSTGTNYDDNVLGDNHHRTGDAEFLFGPSLSLRREGSRLSLALSYQPHFRIYRNESGLNTLDQSLGLDTSYRVSSHFSMRARTNAIYTNGIFQPSQNEEVLPTSGSPTSLNQTVYTPTVRQLSLNSRIDASYQASPHNSIGLYVGESSLDFKEQVSSGGNLQNTEEHEAGLLYQHRLSLHTTLGANYQFQDILFGPDSRTLVHSFFFSYAQQFSPSLSLSVFGGPQHSHTNEIIPFVIGPFTFRIPVLLAGWNWAVGGTLTKRLDRTVFLLTAQREISNGGGLIGAVNGTSVGASVRRQLPGRWDAVWSGNYANNSSLGPAAPAGSYYSANAGFGLERSLSDRLSLRFGYDFLSQHGNGQAPLLGNLNRNLFSVQFSYRFHQIALGQQ